MRNKYIGGRLMEEILVSKQNGKRIPLPAPVTISAGDEILWSSNTGRASTGKMIGDVIAQKETLSIKWQYVTAVDKNVIKTALSTGFFPIEVNIDGNPYTITVYRGTLKYEAMGKLDDGIYYFREITVDIIEQ